MWLLFCEMHFSAFCLFFYIGLSFFLVICRNSLLFLSDLCGYLCCKYPLISRKDTQLSSETMYSKYTLRKTRDEDERGRGAPKPTLDIPDKTWDFGKRTTAGGFVPRLLMGREVGATKEKPVFVEAGTGEGVDSGRVKKQTALMKAKKTPDCELKRQATLCSFIFFLVFRSFF